MITRDILMRFFMLICLLKLGLSQNRTRCFECTGLPNPRDCDTVTECEKDEKCFLQQYVTTNSNVKFDMGCSSPNRCNALSKGRRSRDDDIVTCKECCDGEFCNNKGCNRDLPARQSRGPFCFNCQHMLDPHACRTVTLCSHREACRVQTVFVGTMHLYSSGCIGLACTPLNNSTIILHKKCPLCCVDDYCNDHCRP